MLAPTFGVAATAMQSQVMLALMVSSHVALEVLSHAHAFSYVGCDADGHSTATSAAMVCLPAPSFDLEAQGRLSGTPERVDA